MKLLAKFIEIIKANLKISIAYVVSSWAGLVVGIINISVYYYIWMSIFGENTVLNGISKHQMVTYIILARVIGMQITWGANIRVGNLIYDGQIANELLRPVDFQVFMFATRVSGIVSNIFMTSIPILLVSLLFFGISLPASVMGGISFIISILLGISIAFMIEFSLGLISFYTNNGWGVQVLKEAAISFLSGILIPISFFPGWLKSVVEYLPFKEMVYTPLSIYLGLIKGEKILEALVFQIIWLISLMLLSRLFFNIAIKKVTVQGG